MCQRVGANGNYIAQTGGTSCKPGAKGGAGLTNSENERVFHAALCESDPAFLRAGAALLQSLFQERGLSFRLDLFSEAAALREALRGRPARYDLLLLSISPGGEDGVALAESLRAAGCRACLGFVADTPDRAFDAFRAAPADYLLRPVTHESLARLLGRALGDGGGRAALPVETEHGLRRVYAADIVYVEVSDRALALHLRSGTVSASGSLTALQERLPPDRFFRCHKSFLVNLDFVQGVRRYRVQLKDGAVIPVGKSRYLALRAAFTARLGGFAAE